MILGGINLDLLKASLHGKYYSTFLQNMLNSTRVPSVAIYDLLEKRRINNVTVNFFISLIIYSRQ